MKNALNKQNSMISSGSEKFGIPAWLIKLQLVLPMIIVLTFSLMWFVPATHKYALWVSKENHPAELLTFICLFIGSIIGARLAWKLKQNKQEPPLVWLFIAFFSLGLFVIAMEEISWGQQFLKFDTPEALLEINEQNELTLHNIQGLHGNSEYFHLFFGLAGLIGIWANLYILNKVKVPNVLVAWFATIVAVAILDLYNDFYPFDEGGRYFTRRLSEINEMLIGIAGFAYMWLLSRKFNNLYRRQHEVNLPEEEVVVH
jgi:hypothetical protein